MCAVERDVLLFGTAANNPKSLIGDKTMIEGGEVG